MASGTTPRLVAAVVCLSHLRWHFVFQRPQHLMTRFAHEGRVFFVEEPVFEPGIEPHFEIDSTGPVAVLVPHLPEGSETARADAAQRRLIDDFLRRERVHHYILWYYTPMALAFTDHLEPAATVYDCMDELSAFRGAPPMMTQWEARLMARADLVCTGGQSLYEAKRDQHHNIHSFPSSVDVKHFAQARRTDAEPADQAFIPRPRLGFFGVIDERMDIDLIDAVAAGRPDWQIVMLGPVVKIDPASLPHRPNIHFLGSKHYDDLPRYVAGWDVALLPFVRNDATRFISPTKTPEYMAAGRPVVSTSIRDVVRPYGDQGLVRIADDAPSFVRACAAAMAEDPVQRLTRDDAFLRQTSWDTTWGRIRVLIDAVLASRPAASGAVAQGVAG
jgi:glycosyltransferase involved in cell wall biosynthesis